MAKNSRYTVEYRRKRENKTNYTKRLKLLKSNKIRMVLRKSNKNVWVQFVEYHPDGDKIVASMHSRHLKDMGWNACLTNLPACYLLGLMAGKKAVKNGIKEAILDIGL